MSKRSSTTEDNDCNQAEIPEEQMCGFQCGFGPCKTKRQVLSIYYI